MKELLIISLAVLAFVACSKGEELEKNEAQVAIAFGELETRAEVNGPSDIMEFGVYGKISNRDDASSYNDILTNERIYRSNTITGWDYDNTCYWLDGHTYHFFGIYPYENNPNRVHTATLEQNNKEYDGFQIVFTTPQKADTDLLTAFETVTADATDYKPVNLEFAHALSKIVVQIAKHSDNAANKVEVTSVSLSGIKQSGTYHCSCESGYTNHWTIDTEEETMDISLDNQKTELTTNGTNVLEVLLVPQAIEQNSIILKVEYSFYYPNGVFAYSTPIEKAIPITQIDEWQPSTNYVYNVNLSAEKNDIIFGTPTISEWGAAQSGGTIVIK